MTKYPRGGVEETFCGSAAALGVRFFKKRTETVRHDYKLNVESREEILARGQGV